MTKHRTKHLTKHLTQQLTKQRTAHPLLKPAGIALATLALIAALLTVPLTLVGKNRFKATLIDSVRVELGYELTLAGDIELSLFPRFEFSIRDVRLRNPAFPQELASAREAVIRLDLREFARNSLRIDELSVDGLHINQRIDTGGSSIWRAGPAPRDSRPGDRESPSSDTPDRASREPSDTEESSGFSIGRIGLADVSLDFQDLRSGYSASLRDLSFDTIGVNSLGTPFDLQGQATLATFSPLHRDETSIPLTFGAQLRISAEEQRATISRLSVGISPMLAVIDAELSWKTDDWGFSGTAAASAFDLDALLRGLEPETLSPLTQGEQTRSDIDSSTRFALDFSNDRDGFSIRDFDAVVGDARIDADLSLMNARAGLPASLNYSLRGSAIDFGFLSEARAHFWQPLPLALLGSPRINTSGTLDIDSLQWGPTLLSGLRLLASAEGTAQHYELQPLGVDTGRIGGTLRVVRHANGPPSFSLEGDLSGIDMIRLHGAAPWLAAVHGKLGASFALSGAGEDWLDIANSLEGDLTFDVRDNDVDIGLLKQVFSSIAALSPSGGSTERWPDAMEFTQLSGFVTLSDGVDSPHFINVLLDNLEIEGNGSADLAAGAFDYRLAFTLLPDARTPALEINDAHVGRPWPVICAATLAAPSAQFCGPDFAAVRELFNQPQESTPPLQHHRSQRPPTPPTR